MHRNDSFYYWKTWKKTVDSFPLKYRRALNHYVCALHVNPKKSYSISFLNMKKRKMVFSKRGETFWKKLQQTIVPMYQIYIVVYLEEGKK